LEKKITPQFTVNAVDTINKFASENEHLKVQINISYLLFNLKYLIAYLVSIFIITLQENIILLTKF